MEVSMVYGWRLWLVLLVACGMVVAGCGSDSKPVTFEIQHGGNGLRGVLLDASGDAIERRGIVSLDLHAMAGGDGARDLVTLCSIELPVDRFEAHAGRSSFVVAPDWDTVCMGLNFRQHLTARAHWVGDDGSTVSSEFYPFPKALAARLTTHRERDNSAFDRLERHTFSDAGFSVASVGVPERSPLPGGQPHEFRLVVVPPSARGMVAVQSGELTPPAEDAAGIMSGLVEAAATAASGAREVQSKALMIGSSHARRVTFTGQRLNGIAQTRSGELLFVHRRPSTLFTVGGIYPDGDLERAKLTAAVIDSFRLLPRAAAQ